MKFYKINPSDIPDEEKTPLVLKLLENNEYLLNLIQVLKDEISRLKNKPPRPKLKPSTVHKIDKNFRQKDKQKKHQNKKKKNKKHIKVKIHNTVELHPKNIPDGSQFLWYKNFIEQDIFIQTNNTLYRRGVWKTPNRKIIHAKLPKNIKGHYGSNLQSMILYLYHKLHVTEPLILSFLNEIDIKISAGKINQLLINDKEKFHQEKEEILETGLKISPYIVTDDTGLRHKGKNGYCTHIGNELFAYFKSTDSKSRINFLKIMRGQNTNYCINGYSISYYENQKLSSQKLTLLKRSKGKEFKDIHEWSSYLKQLGIRDEYSVKKSTEGALIGSLFALGINPNLSVISDDAGQFDILRHGLCWVHSERVITSINSVSYEQDQLIKEILNEFWNLFRELYKYKQLPSVEKRKEINDRFNNLFSKKTPFDSLNDALKSLKIKKKELLLVLEQHEIPLTNNISENDIRDQAKKRKISAGTRSDIGRECRDSFMSIKKTCAKLNIPFMKYINDRISGENKIQKLAKIMQKKAMKIYGLPPPTF